jgi:hypothetical protein
MHYLKVFWKHEHADEPVWLYSELDDDRWEIRKVEQFADGSTRYAGQDAAEGGSKLSIEPLPAWEEIAEDPQFTPSLIDAGEFDKVWRRRLDKLRM